MNLFRENFYILNPKDVLIFLIFLIYLIVKLQIKIYKLKEIN